MQEVQFRTDPRRAKMDRHRCLVLRALRHVGAAEPADHHGDAARDYDAYDAPGVADLAKVGTYDDAEAGHGAVEGVHREVAAQYHGGFCNPEVGAHLLDIVGEVYAYSRYATLWIVIVRRFRQLSMHSEGFGVAF